MNNMPDFLVIGLAKSGTTSLYSYLAAHPQLAMSANKEPNFFEFGETEQPWALAFFPRVHAVRTLTAYQALFAALPADRLQGEASPSNIEARACARIHQYLPAARLICILRQPVDRAYSQFAMRRRNLTEREADFRRAYYASPQRWERRYVDVLLPYAYTQASWYISRLQDWFSRFAREQLHIGLYDDLKLDAATYMHSVYTFLNVAPTFTPDVSQVHNPGYSLRSARLQQLLRGQHGFKDRLKSWLPAPVRRVVRQRLQQLNQAPLPPLDPDVRRELTRPQHDDILRLQDLLGRDLAHWLAE